MSDVLVMNSQHGDVPCALSRSVGVPIIATDVKGIGESVKFGINAIKTGSGLVSMMPVVGCVKEDCDQFSQGAFAHSVNVDHAIIGAEVLCASY